MESGKRKTFFGKILSSSKYIPIIAKTFDLIGNGTNGTYGTNEANGNNRKYPLVVLVPSATLFLMLSCYYKTKKQRNFRPSAMNFLFSVIA